MRFDLTIDKKAEAVIDRRSCINCGECREICPTGAVRELQKTAICMKSGEDGSCFSEAKRQSVEKACSTGCPLGIVPQTVTSFVERGEIQSAAEHIREKNPMPGVCAAVCELMCAASCKRTVFDNEPINMRALEGYVLDKTEAKPFKYIRKYHEKIAVIGGGPAGLSAAYHAAKAGYGVTVFEKDARLGGALRWGIPSFRLDKELVQEEIDRIVDAGIEVRCGCDIGQDISLDSLWDEGYSACIIAAGESYGVQPDVSEVEGVGVYDGVKVMRQITGGYDEGAYIGDTVIISGSDGFAADLARALRRTGKEVICVTEDREGSVADTELAEVFEAEGIELRAAAAIGQIITEGGKVKAVELVKIDHIEDETGRLQPHRVKGSGLNLFCDTVVFVTGQKSVVDGICNAETYPDGKLKTDEKYKTNKDRIYACGDVTGKTNSVVEAIAAGRDAAAEVDRALSGSADTCRYHEIISAPDGQAIYPANVRRPVPQYEEEVMAPIPDEEDPFAEDDEGVASVLQNKAEYTEDVLAIIRAAGIPEEMPVFEFAPDAKKAAVIGGGIAGITAAISLARKGFKPAIFEKMPALGGSLRWLSTEKRVDKKLLAGELKKVEDSGIEVIYGASAGIKPNVEELFSMGFDAILFAIGEYGGEQNYIDETAYDGIYDMVSLMRKIVDNEVPEGLGDKVLVAGGDELTFDIARNLRAFCKEVTILAPWSRGSLQARTGAVDAALEEGVNLVTGVELAAIEDKDGRVYNVICNVTERKYTISVPCDTLILSGGGPDTQTIALRNLKLDIEENGNIVVDHRLASSITGVFSIGGLEMSAADAGRTGAAAVENRLTNTDSYISIADPDQTALPVSHEMIEGSRHEKLKGFEIGRKVLTDMQVAVESSRCMKCGYHMLQADMCMGCGVCVKTCPAGAITMMPVDVYSDAGEEVQP